MKRILFHVPATLAYLVGFYVALRLLGCKPEGRFAFETTLLAAAVPLFLMGLAQKVVRVFFRKHLDCIRDIHTYAGCSARKTTCPDCGGEGVVAETLCCRVKEKFVHVQWADVPACPDNAETCTPIRG